ncbi:hypothetical protein Glove_33g264 [Diversispora epigaea]|uniref:Uncharacterized protein n=1 Tax=Diversispora epigaea TaxID=1348612 RepID=A0A397JJT6_9GLOM|nr:hypothetical protein Glove_33g264 [Diversispora epigaea]
MKRLRSPSEEVSDLTPPPCKRIIIKRSPGVIAQRRQETLGKVNDILKPLFAARRDQKTFTIPPISEVLIKKRKVTGDDNNDNNNDSSEISDLRQTPRKRIKIKRSPEIMAQGRKETLDKAKKILKPLFATRKNQKTFSVPSISKVLIKKR